MKILAVIDVESSARLDAVRAELTSELKGSWDLFASGVLREAYATSKPTRVVFVLEAEDVAHAQTQLGKLPLIAGGLLHVELIELKPFVNWSRLFSR